MIASKDELFFRDGIRKLPERWEKVVASDEQYFNTKRTMTRAVRDLARLRPDRQVRFTLTNYASTAIQKSVTILGWQEREFELRPHEEAMMVGASESDLKINATGNRTYVCTLGAPFTPQSNVLDEMQMRARKLIYHMKKHDRIKILRLNYKLTICLSYI
ncbi:hypothetical protein ALC62_10411 [Cyphomyrmex costatus]|uniref:Uncharacterized protein n=1 Tax=Cyphomyrmex costatus TaxID=456900 RepID=A0A151IDV2_9HYME|nr:hypothetical protein ALC62_10411 [Cyphomyrmex costatus]